MTSSAQSLVIKVWNQLDLPRKVEKAFLTARSHEFLKSKIYQFFLGGEVSHLKGFVEERFIKVKGNLHRYGYWIEVCTIILFTF
ncbi:hypothetical protein DO97_07900 [Neosynechococcus sphagnicola sy1]|uniref:Uncharacterized protein n=1 Tax=Neosynechococcus sphagnicola sy1 TaxID=1497020 RepID=A0A098TJZ0_9CYAN|nr:hypothetical protein DO97_07900 [Neosynechococcus sphagnicola sy1]